MEPSNEGKEIKAERDGALGTRRIELGFDLQESKESNEEGQAGSGGARCACGEEQSSIYIKDRKAGGMKRDSRRFYFLPNQPHTHSGGFLFQPMSSGALGRNHPESEVTQSCPTLCDPVDCSLSGSPVHGIFQARVLEWIAISFSRGSSRPRNRTPGLPHCRQTLYHLSHQGNHPRHFKM